jgi:hypothetical protein
MAQKYELLLKRKIGNGYFGNGMVVKQSESENKKN